MDIKAKWPTISGCEYYDTKATCIVSGKVLFIGKSDIYYIVTIQSNSSECVRYGHLRSVNVKVNDIVTEGSLIGQTDKFVLFEYCTVAKGTSKFPVRIYTKTYYKQDPMPLLDKKYEVITTPDLTFVNKPGSLIKLTSEQQIEFGNNKGDDIIEF